jgi:hypothetical protein
LAFKLTNAFQVTLTYLLAESVRNPHWIFWMLAEESRRKPGAFSHQNSFHFITYIPKEMSVMQIVTQLKMFEIIKRMRP